MHVYIREEEGTKFTTLIFYFPVFTCHLTDCTFLQEDPWNAIMSGAATGGILAARAGMKAAGKSALVGGVILAAIEGLNIVVVSFAMVFSSLFLPLLTPYFYTDTSGHACL